ncbi:2962_t:CDS:2 [Ambispora leptoticha]|uniref:2962_t:CDS:1 n=1 Tax=Ambispora leptoticha TaxID=144679 RepID=A0A9N9BI07_9GLOM|nr:2962_t:CDS:2 [Ambispora leptoticha]
MHSVWFAIGYFSGIEVYNSHVSRGMEILYGFLFLITAPIGLFGVYATNSQRTNLVRRFSQLYWLAISILLSLHIVDLILAYVWRNDIIRTCNSDLVVLIPANTSTVTVPYDPNAPTPQQVDTACNTSVRLSLTWSLVEIIFIRITLLIYFARIVKEYSKNLTRGNSNTSMEEKKSNFSAADEKNPNPQFDEIESGKIPADPNLIVSDVKNPQFDEIESGKIDNSSAQVTEDL